MVKKSLKKVIKKPSLVLAKVFPSWKPSQQLWVLMRFCKDSSDVSGLAHLLQSSQFLHSASWIKFPNFYTPKHSHNSCLVRGCWADSGTNFPQFLSSNESICGAAQVSAQQLPSSSSHFNEQFSAYHLTQGQALK